MKKYPLIILVATLGMTVVAYGQSGQGGTTGTSGDTGSAATVETNSNLTGIDTIPRPTGTEELKKYESEKQPTRVPSSNDSNCEQKTVSGTTTTTTTVAPSTADKPSSGDGR